MEREIIRHNWPLDDQYYVDIPSRWIGSDYFAYLDAMEITNTALRGMFQKFVVSIAICDNYDLPGLTGKPEQWDYSKVDLQLAAWVTQIVYNDFMKCFDVPKKKSLMRGDLLAEKLLTDMQTTSKVTT